MATPIRAYIGERLEAMRYSMVELLLVGVRLSIRLADAFGHHFRIAALVTCVFAIFALHACRILHKLTTKGATHDTVKLLGDEFMAILLSNFLFALSNGAFTIETQIERPPVVGLFG